MKYMKMTPSCGDATHYTEGGELAGRGAAMRSDFGIGFKGLSALAITAALPGCINIAAPEEPIVIELNINIRAEVLYRLADDAEETIDENADIF
ncbi:MAG: YnbE family lipoprotein [Pseudomonadota bacterium]